MLFKLAHTVYVVTAFVNINYQYSKGPHLVAQCILLQRPHALKKLRGDFMQFILFFLI